MEAAGTSLHPGHDGTIIKTQNQSHAHVNIAPQSFYYADDGRMDLTNRHAIDYSYGPSIRLNFSLQNQGVLFVTPMDGMSRLNGTDGPVSMLTIT
jgi:hypothetical protein